MPISRRLDTSQKAAGNDTPGAAIMKFGFRRPSLRKSFAARTSWKRYARHSMGLKAPRGWGWLTNPRRAAYNRIYNRTTFGWRSLGRKRSAAGCCVTLAFFGVSFVAAVGLLFLGH